MELIDIKLDGTFLHIKYLHNGLKYKNSTIIETHKDIIQAINDIIKSLT